MVEYAGVPRRKRSTGKLTWPGCKQVFRHRDANGLMRADTVGCHGERIDGEQLLKPLIRGGKLLSAMPSLTEIRARAGSELAGLSDALRTMTRATYEVDISGALKELALNCDLRERALEEEDRARWGSVISRT